MNDKDKLILNIVNCLLGSCIRIREIHWNTHNQATHNLTNRVLPEIGEHIDELIELLSGVSERPGFNILKPIIPTSKDLKEILQALVVKSEMACEQLDEVPYKSVARALEELIGDINVFVYLSDNF